MSEDDIVKDMLEKSKNSAIIIKTTKSEKVDSSLRKEIKKIEKLISKLEKEQSSIKFKRDDYQKTMDELFKRLEQSKSKRDTLNSKIPELKNKRNAVEKEKERLINRKRELGNLLQENKKKVEKDILYEEFVKVKETLGQVFEDLNASWDEYKETREKGKEEHENMQVYYQLANQSKSEMNKLNRQVRTIGNKIYNLRKKLRALKRNTY